MKTIIKNAIKSSINTNVGLAAYVPLAFGTVTLALLITAVFADSIIAAVVAMLSAYLTVKSANMIEKKKPA